MNIYVSGLNYNTGSEDLQELFAEYGEVSSARVITDRETNRSRSFGFVEMTNDEEGQKAIDELNGATYDGNSITVSIAREKRERSNDRYNRGGGGGNGGFNGRRY